MADIPNSSTGDGGDQPNDSGGLPINNVIRIMRKALPSNGKISKDAKETVQECTAEFISFITCEANLICQNNKRSSINGDDLLLAMHRLGFEDYVAPLRIYLDRYREFKAVNKGYVSGEGTSARMETDSGPMHSSVQQTHQGSITSAINYMDPQGEGLSARMDTGVSVSGEGSSTRMHLSTQVPLNQDPIDPADELNNQVGLNEDEVGLEDEPKNQEQLDEDEVDPELDEELNKWLF